MNRNVKELVDQINAFIEDNDLLTDAGVRNFIYESFFVLHPSEQAHIIAQLKNRDIRKIFVDLIITDTDPTVLFYMEPTARNEIIQMVGHETFARMVSLLEIHDAARILSEIDKDVKRSVMENISLSRRVQIKRLLAYPEGVVGRMMSVDYTSVPSYIKVSEVFGYIDSRSRAGRERASGDIFVLNSEGHVLGIVSVVELVKFDGGDAILRHCHEIRYIANTDDTIEMAVKMFMQYDLTVAPVADRSGRMVGILDVAKMSDLVYQRVEQDFLSSRGVFEKREDGIADIAKIRFIWLFINILTAIFASMFISMFDDVIAGFATLAVLMPITASMGGNCGTQTATVIIRCIALGRVSVKQVLTEIIVASINGIAFAMLSSAGVMLAYHNIRLSLVFGAALLITMICAGLGGTLIPVTLNRLKFDPAVSTTIFLTTVTDVSGFFSFLGLSKLFLL